ncbi:MAG: O-antigen ligase family protein, partial [Alcaligenaceae bacterium]|nr:O-antigen ligase family protein [Alcaligenaceae bacterium]
VFLLGAISLVVDSGYSIGCALLLLGGLYSLFVRKKLVLTREDWLVIGVLLAFGLVNILDVALHQAGSRYLDKPVRFILAAFAFVLVRKYPPRLSWLWAGLAVGGILTGGWSFYQKLFLNIDRAGGFTFVIQYGNISMLTGFLCLAGLAWAHVQPQRKIWVPFLLIGAAGGMMSSLLSGSRGGWVGLPLVFLVLYRAYGDFFSTRWKVLGLGLLMAAAALVYSAPQLGVQGRVLLAINDIKMYSQGESVSSLGARFEMWKGASQLFLQKPVFGWGSINYEPAMQELVKQGKAHPIVSDFGHAHNEFIDNAAKRGMIGLLSLLALYLVPLRLFSAGLRSPDMTLRSLATAGTLLPVAYIDFGLSQVFFAHNSGVMIYAFWLMVLWGCYRNAQDGRSNRLATTHPGVA